MTHHLLRRAVMISLIAGLLGVTSGLKTDALSRSVGGPPVVRCASLIYGKDKASECFASQFLEQMEADTQIRTDPVFKPVRLESADLFDYPFAIMTGEGEFTLTEAQRQQMRTYLEAGGFIVASAGCSSESWNKSFKREIARVFAAKALERLDGEHEVFHTVYDITSSKYKSGDNKLPHLEGLTLDDRIVLVYSPDGLNDTGNAGEDCCCCGGNEIRSAKQLNVNLLAYALTH